MTQYYPGYNIHYMTKAIRQKRGDTLVKTIERNYKIDLGYRGDAKLSTVLRKEGVLSLSKLVKMTENKRQK